MVPMRYLRTIVPQSAMFLLLLFLLVLSPSIVTGNSELSPGLIYDVQVTQGSYAGGTYLTIWGSGFNRDGQEGATIA